MTVKLQVKVTPIPTPRDTTGDCCEAFSAAVRLGVIKEQTHQFLNSRTGDLTRVRYYYLGPKDVRKSLIFEFCPACGKRVKVNQDFLNTPGLFVEEARNDA